VIKNLDQLRQERGWIQKYLDLVDDMLLELNRQGGVEMINRRGCDILGYEEEEILGKNWFENFLPESNREGVKMAFDLLMAGEIEPVEYYENPVLARSGKERLLAWRNTVLLNESGDIEGTLSSGEDITERKDSEARIQAILDTTVDGIITINEFGKIESFNPAAERIFGYESSEIVGHNVRVLMREPDRGAHDGYLENYLETGEAKIIGIGREVTGLRRDGTPFAMDLAISEFQLGNRRMFTSIIRDITDRKRLEEQLLQSAKLAALGELVGGIAHEVNNPTGIIVMRSANLMQEVSAQGLGEDLRDDVEVIQRQSDKLAQITSGLLAFSRQTPFSPQNVDLNRTVVNAVGLVENVLRIKGITYVPELDPELPIVSADTTRVEQVLLNIFNNAMDAMPDGGELLVSTCVDEGKAGDRWVKVDVKDSGGGISEADLKRIFDPFFTTKEVGKGTGLGLSISYGIIQEHGGRLEAESKWGHGATFRISLPCVVEEKTDRKR